MIETVYHTKSLMNPETFLIHIVFKMDYIPAQSSKIVVGLNGIKIFNSVHWAQKPSNITIQIQF